MSQVDGGGDLRFPDAPQLRLDELLAQLIDRAQDVIAAQGRLRGLLRASQSITGDLDLPVVLRRVAEAARQLVGARYGALGVVGASGGLQEFIVVGIDAPTAEAIGPLPTGKGLLGALIEDPRPIRLRTMSDDIRSVGFPAGHPPMASFLGVPIRVRDVVFGNLYLAEAAAGEFTEEDEELVRALAATAGVAIENARLFEQAAKRQQWLQASTRVTRQLLTIGGEDPLEVLAQQAFETAEADVLTVVLPQSGGEELVVAAAVGDGMQSLRGHTYAKAGTLAGAAIETAESILIADATDSPIPLHLSERLPVGPVMVVPLVGASGVRGAMFIARILGRAGFGPGDLDMAKTFANHAVVALELGDARADQERMALLEDRDRIARDLHDHVIQRLFAAGLMVDSVAGGLDDAAKERLGKVVTALDDTIRQIRSSIFQLRGSLGPDRGTRLELINTARDVAPTLGFEPKIEFLGPIDTAVPEPVVDELVAVTREALTNVARHASATSVVLRISLTSTGVALTVVDDGVGLGAATRRSGLANLRDRAERRGGSLAILSPAFPDAPPDRGGTQLTWTVPLV